MITFDPRYKIEYFHPRVLAEIARWPVDVLADYARLIEVLSRHGPTLRLPHSRAMGDGLFELRPRGRSVIGRAFYCFVVDDRIVILHAFIKKQQQTPQASVEIARQRARKVKRG